MRRLILILSIFTSLSISAKDGYFLDPVGDGNVIYIKGDKGFAMAARVKIVESFPDLKVQVVNSFPDVKIKIINERPDKGCEWQIVESFPDYKIQFVESFPDIKVQFVNSFPGVPHPSNK